MCNADRDLQFMCALIFVAARSNSTLQFEFFKPHVKLISSMCCGEHGGRRLWRWACDFFVVVVRKFAWPLHWGVLWFYCNNGPIFPKEWMLSLWLLLGLGVLGRSLLERACPRGAGPFKVSDCCFRSWSLSWSDQLLQKQFISGR